MKYEDLQMFEVKSHSGFGFSIAGESWELLQDGLDKAETGLTVVGVLKGIVGGVMTEGTADEIISVMSALEDGERNIKH